MSSKTHASDNQEQSNQCITKNCPFENKDIFQKQILKISLGKFDFLKYGSKHTLWVHVRNASLSDVFIDIMNFE